MSYQFYKSVMFLCQNTKITVLVLMLMQVFNLLMPCNETRPLATGECNNSYLYHKNFLIQWFSLNNQFNFHITVPCSKASNLISQLTEDLRVEKKEVYLLSPPGVFGCVETDQVFILFKDIHLQTRPATKDKNNRQWAWTIRSMVSGCSLYEAFFYQDVLPTRNVSMFKSTSRNTKKKEIWNYVNDNNQKNCNYHYKASHLSWC